MSLDISRDIEELNNNLRELARQLDKINDVQRSMLLRLESMQKQLTITNEEGANDTEN